MTTESNHPQSVKEKAAEGVLGSVVSLILSTGLLGGCTYMLFGFREDLHRLNVDRAKIAEEITENDLAMQVTNWWNQPEHQHAQSIVHLLNQLSAVKHITQLDPQFQSQWQRQAQSILVALTTLKGDIEGRHFSNPALTRYQQSLAQTLEPQIQMISVLRDLLRSWQGLTVGQRTAELDRVHEQVLRQVEKQAQHMSVIRDAMAYQQQKMKDDELRNAEILNRCTNLYIKVALSGTGILAGIVLLCWSLPRIWPTLKNPRKARR